MIISHRHRFVFVETNKTAGSSFEILLSDVLGPDDIATKLDKAEEKLRDHLSSRGHWQSPRRRKGIRQHSSYEQALLAHPECAEYFSFGFVRNPFSRLLSSFRWKRAAFIRQHLELARETPDIYESTASPILHKFKQFVSSGRHKLNTRGADLLQGKESKVHHVYRYEQMAEAVEDISRRIEAPLSIQALPHLKANTPRIPRQWTLWDDELVTTVNAMFSWEFESFGYSRSP